VHKDAMRAQSIAPTERSSDDAVDHAGIGDHVLKRLLPLRTWAAAECAEWCQAISSDSDTIALRSYRCDGRHVAHPSCSAVPHVAHGASQWTR
jgi:hypothetical protein